MTAGTTIVCAGPSILAVSEECLRSYFLDGPVVAVNMAIARVPDADVWAASERPTVLWTRLRRCIVPSSPGVKVNHKEPSTYDVIRRGDITKHQPELWTTTGARKAEQWEKYIPQGRVLALRTDEVSPWALPDGLRWKTCTTSMAIGRALKLGQRKIRLIGCDMAGQDIFDSYQDYIPVKQRGDLDGIARVVVLEGALEVEEGVEADLRTALQHLLLADLAVVRKARPRVLTRRSGVVDEVPRTMDGRTSRPLHEVREVLQRSA